VHDFVESHTSTDEERLLVEDIAGTAMFGDYVKR